MIVKNKNTNFAVIDPKGKVNTKWFKITDLVLLAGKNDMEMAPKDTVPKLVAKLEDIGYVIISYGNIPCEARVPKEELYDDWKTLQLND
ncbi:MAG: hypothetical protein SLAVMIC_00377 [uncultured marine phage]|uniref:Uncharacterized protein n=1 Tax=uncultured marine phage TaxID=707152 RepID=A0A8D9CC50_9VIRU|nr:MAG: hypothetical protein SLAVMIC_00377 [uncultured marine phage]